MDVELSLVGLSADAGTGDALRAFGQSGQQFAWALARSWQAKGWFKPDLGGDGEEDEGLDILDRCCSGALVISPALVGHHPPRWDGDRSR